MGAPPLRFFGNSAKISRILSAHFMKISAKGHSRSGHQQRSSEFMRYNFWLRWDTGFKPPAIRWPCSDKSLDTQHDLFKSGHVLHLRPNFKADRFRSNYVSFDAAGRKKDVYVRTILLYFSGHKLLLENNFGPFRLFWSCLPLKAKRLTGGKIWQQNR